MKLIKSNEQHYIVVDDSEIKEGDIGYFINDFGDLYYAVCTIPKTQDDYIEVKLFINNQKNCVGKNEFKKVTHSTLPNKGMENVNFISLSEVEEAIYGCSIDNKIAKHLEKNHIEASPKRVQVVKSLVEELVKDKLFTIEDLRRAFDAGNEGLGGSLRNRVRKYNGFDEYITNELGYVWDEDNGYVKPKQIEWECYFDEQGKLKSV